MVAALRAANMQVAAGAINQPPATSPVGFEVAVQTSAGCLSGAVQRHHRRHRCGRPGDARAGIGRVELGAYTYVSNADPDCKVATAIGIFQRRRARTRSTTAAGVLQTMDEPCEELLPGFASYRVAYNTTEFVEQSVDEVIKTLVRSGRAGGAGHHSFLADLARRDRSCGRYSGVADRYVLRVGHLWFLAGIT